MFIFGLAGLSNVGSRGISGGTSRSLSCPLFVWGVCGGVAAGSGVVGFFDSSDCLGVSAFLGVFGSVVGAATGLAFARG